MFVYFYTIKIEGKKVEAKLKLSQANKNWGELSPVDFLSTILREVFQREETWIYIKKEECQRINAGKIKSFFLIFNRTVQSNNCNNILVILHYE